MWVFSSAVHCEKIEIDVLLPETNWQCQMETYANSAFRDKAKGRKQWKHSNAHWKSDCESLTTISMMLLFLFVNGLLKISFSTLCLKLHRKFGLSFIQSMHSICFSTFSLFLLISFVEFCCFLRRCEMCVRAVHFKSDFNRLQTT